MAGALKALVAPGQWVTVGTQGPPGPAGPVGPQGPAGSGLSQATADTLYVNVSGDAMTGALTISAPVETLKLARTDGTNSPHIGFYDSAVSTRYGWIMAKAAGLSYMAQAAAGMTHSFGFNGVEAARIDETNSLYVLGTNLILGNATASGRRHRIHDPGSGSSLYYDFDDGAGTAQLLFRVGTTQKLSIGPNTVRTYVPAYFGGQTRAFSTVPQFVAAGTGNSAYVALYGNATDIDTLGTRSGYWGFSGGVLMSIVNEVADGAIRLNCTNGTGNIDFYTGGTYSGRFTANGDFLVKNTALASATQGAALSASGRCYTVTQQATSYNVISNIIAAIDNSVHASFRRSDTIVGSILMNGTTGITYATSSDERFKSVLREVDEGEAIERLRAFRPVVYQWKLDHNETATVDGTPSGNEEWGLLAQEAVDVDPVAVSIGRGEPRSSDFEPWSIDYGRLTPDLIAALQVVERRVSALEAAAA